MKHIEIKRYENNNKLYYNKKYLKFIDIINLIKSGHTIECSVLKANGKNGKTESYTNTLFNKILKNEKFNLIKVMSKEDFYKLIKNYPNVQIKILNKEKK